MTSTLHDYLELHYEKLEELNLEAKSKRLDRTPLDKLREERMKYLTDEKRIKAVTVCFTDLEGRLHMLDYDKKFLLKSADNLTFDGSSVRGFSQQSESDLRLSIDWSAFYWLPSDIFSPGKVLVFGEVLERDGNPYSADLRSILKNYSAEQYQKNGYTFNLSNEIEGFIFQGMHAEQRYIESGEFEFVSTGGYYHSLPGDTLRSFIDRAADVQRAMGFANEKDHPEVAPSQFEMNYSYAEAVVAADQVQLYKLLSRQVAQQLNMTASFLPKPVTGINGSGMHTNMSIANSDTNLFYQADGKDGVSTFAWDFVNRILSHGREICLILNPSVNSYRRLDPHFEAPNQIKASAIDRGSMVRIPIGNSRSARIEVRSIAPDVNPYLAIYTLFRTGLEGTINSNLSKDAILPDNIYDAIADFQGGNFIQTLLGGDIGERYATLKQASAERCPRLLGSRIKRSEIQFHHEVTNQFYWNRF
jgi:glutamine synthetase